LIESQKVYVGSLSPSVSQEHLFALFSPFGQLERVVVQMDLLTGASKGFAFLSFRDPKEANLAIQTMAGQILAGRPMKTGWANQVSSIPGVETVTSGEFPADASERTTRAYQVLAQLTTGAPVPMVGQVPTPTSTATQAAVQQLVMGHSQSAAPAMPAASGIPRVGTVAEARASLAAGNATATQGLPPMLGQPQVWAATTTAAAAAAAVVSAATAAVDATKVGNAESPTKNVLVHNMYNKDEETEPGWEEDIRLEFQEESAKFGKIVKVTVMSKEPGGKIYASFDSIQGAQSCTSSLAGRWFDKRQLRVEFVKDDELPSE
jgi:RNA-binding protein 39